MNLIERIQSLPHRITPIESEKVTMNHSDGLSQTHNHDTYSDKIQAIRKELWFSDLSLEEKIEASNLLASKMKL